MKYFWVIINLNTLDAVLFTTKSLVAKHLNISVKTLDRWLISGHRPENILILHLHINRGSKHSRNTHINP